MPSGYSKYNQGGWKHSKKTKDLLSVQKTGKKRRPFSESHKKKISLALRGKRNNPFRSGEDNPMWRGGKPLIRGYRAIHYWVQNHYGKANCCEFCGLEKVPVGMKIYFNWANRSGEYLRNITDWLQLCKKCHFHFDNR